MNKIRIGRYIDKSSWLHRIDPRIKLVANILMLIVTFAIRDLILLAIFDFIVIMIFISINIGNSYLLRLLKIVLPIFIMVFLFEAWMFPPGNKVFYSSKHFKVGIETLRTPARIALRIYAMIALAFMFSSTTRPLDVTKSIEDLLFPLKLIKFPAHIIAMVISIALQFSPSMIEHAKKVSYAQASRGFDVEHSSWFKKIESIRMIWVPMLAAAFNNALQLGYAMDARAYDPYSPKSNIRKFNITISSILLLISAITIITLAFLAKNSIFTTYPDWWV